MIKFFRQIRQRMLSENKFNKYLLYAIGEIILVVIGILVALSINNWNERLKEQKLEKAILAEIKLNIQKDFEDHFQNIYTLEGSINGAKIILTHLNENLPYSESLNEYLMWMLLLPDFNPITSGYERLKEGTITNDSLRIDISYLYGNTYNWINRRTDQIREFSLYPLQNQIIPYLQKFNFESVYFSGDLQDVRNARYRVSAQPRDYELLLNDDKLKSLIDSHISTLNFHLQSYTRRIELGNEIIQQIDKLINLK